VDQEPLMEILNNIPNRILQKENKKKSDENPEPDKKDDHVQDITPENVEPEIEKSEATDMNHNQDNHEKVSVKDVAIEEAEIELQNMSKNSSEIIENSHAHANNHNSKVF
jgi:hypothetical protein